MFKCPKCGTEMESKGRLDDSSGAQRALLQCPNCKNIEFHEKTFNSWFRLDYP